ncbi:hypothetical protein QYE76_017682 [Lolium multiflorum]|uniref:DUF8039 domain-containing protein n=1 Tax=Lolium multiflorum TaxID=4521 RepID=A0AAD8PIZ8_LOLMU|nr:hypothetical protein QYE76_017682 [Lolium multiflorum]
MVRNNMTLIRCPCRKCGLRQWIDPDSGQLEEHLLRRGFMLGFNEEPAANVGHEEEADIGREDEESPEHGVHHEEGEADEGDDDAGGDGGGDAERKQTPLTSALRDPHVQELLLKDTGNAKPEAKLAQMEVDGMTPLYPGCRPEDTRLSVTLECLEMKAEHKWTDNSFSDNMKSWHARLPKDNTLPTSIDEAKKVVCPLDLPHVKYHACINDCALFRNEYKDRTTCPVCGQGRYKRGNKKVPLKVVWYFPITPRLQRYFVDPKEAKLMQWHAEREKPADDPEKGKILTHPADASQWNALDIEFADEFGSEPRNIRLGMSTDGLNPFGNQSSTHSTWPVFVWPYNLPPGCAQSSVQERLDSEDAKAWTEWGRQMHELNLGAHHLGSGGYRGKIPIWEKEDEELARAGKPNPWLKIADLQVRYFVRARYTLDRNTMEFVTEHDDVRKFEEKLNEQLAKADLPEAESSSQGSTEPWDTPFNRALNILKERPVSKPPTSAGRVCGFGTSMKFREYYKEENSKKRRRSAMSEEDKAEVEELRKKVSMLEEKQANSMDKDEVDKLFEKKLRDFLPPQVIEGIAAWNAAGQVGSIKVPSAGASNSIFNASPSPDLVTPPPTIAAGQPMELDEPVPPADPAEATKAQPAAVVLHNAPEPQKIDRPAATVSTLAQLNAITKDTPCVLLHCAPGGELKDVATGMIIQPKSTTLHTVAMDANVLKVTLGRVLPGCEDMDPPIQPEGADEHLTLENCHGYTMVWPKTQIRLGGRSTGASSIIRQPIVRPPARRAAPPVVTATTSRHKKLLGESLPQPPPAEPKGKAAAPLSPIPSPNEDDIDDDGPVDVDAYLNTGADIDDLYMAGADEEAYRARDEPAGPPKATKQRLVFRGFSQETPPAADTQEPTAANIFSPNTLINKVNEQFEASGAVAPKKPRKRPSKNKEKSASQPPPTIRHRDSMVPPSKDGLTRMHEAGKPILGPELQHIASGDMLPLQDSILVLESILLKDKDPNYPVFTVKVPRDVGFVTDAPADIFFIAYEDIFKLFHARRLDYNLVRLFALNLAMKIKRESTPDVAIADPYYMRESQLNLSAVRVRASLYLQKCFLDNKRKDNILLAYFPEDTHCVLISIAPKFSLATYFDSGSAKKKNYARIRGVLDDALEGYFKKGGAFKEKAECFRDDGKHKFKHVFEFPCVKQPENSTLDAFYVMHHLKGFVRDSQNLRLPSALRGWAEKLARINDDDLREDFQDTRVKLSHIIIQDVTTGGGPLHQGRALCKRDIEHRLKAQGDTRTWITKDLYKPFPEPCEP